MYFIFFVFQLARLLFFAVVTLLSKFLFKFSQFGAILFRSMFYFFVKPEKAGCILHSRACPAPGGGISRPCFPNHCLCTFKREVCPKARIVPQKNVTGPVPLQCISDPVPPHNSASAPSVSKNTLKDEKHEETPKPKILRQRPFFFLVFNPEFVGKKRDLQY